MLSNKLSIIFRPYIIQQLQQTFQQTFNKPCDKPFNRLATDFEK